MSLYWRRQELSPTTLSDHFHLKRDGNYKLKSTLNKVILFFDQFIVTCMLTMDKFACILVLIANEVHMWTFLQNKRILLIVWVTPWKKKCGNGKWPQKSYHHCWEYLWWALAGKSRNRRKRLSAWTCIFLIRNPVHQALSYWFSIMVTADQ